MTAAEACALSVTTIRDLSVARAEAEAYKLLAQQAIHALHDSHAELQRTKKAYYALLDEARELRRASRPAA